MARVTRVKKAQQRYETRPVLDADGKPKRTPVLVDGVQKVSKRGPVWMAVTEADHSRPKPNYMCDFCGKAIEVGTAYKHISPKSGPYGGTKKTRHEEHPDWQVWEYSSSTSARLAQIAWEASQSLGDIATKDDVDAVIEQAKESIMELVEEKREAAQNIEDGFQHETSQSQELNELADALESWADEGDQIEVEDEPDEDIAEMVECSVCDGEGEVDNEDGTGVEECTECEGEGEVDNDEYDADAPSFETWSENVISEVEAWLENNPV